MTDETSLSSEELTVPTCYRHAGRETHIRCQRCERPICPDCMQPASVGFQCPECVKEGARTTRAARTAYGGRLVGTRPLVTQVLIGINAAVFLIILATGSGRSQVLTRLWLIPGSVCEITAGGACNRVITGVADGAYWELLTSVFTHVQIWHIGFNMLALWVLGPQLESLLGRGRFLALYLLSGLFGSLAVYWLTPTNAPTVGASGAIFGLMGALLVVAIRSRGDVSSLLTLIGINLVITVIGSGYISWQGHLGGFLGGVLLAGVLVYAPRQHRSAWQLAGLGLALVVVVIGVLLRTIALA